jgi:flagellar hook-associated protein 3 FlgL
MRVASSTFPDNFLYQTNNLQAQQNQLQQEASSGLKLTLPEDNPSAMAQVLNLQVNSDANLQYQTNITNLTNQATSVSSALTSLQTIVSKAGEITTSADGITSPAGFTSYATQVGELIQQALQLANSKDSQGNYIFGGTKSGAPPFTATTDSSGNVTGVTYNGNTSVNQTEIGPGITVAAQVPGANTTGSGPNGLFADSRSGADLFNHLISLQQHLTAGNASAISTTDAPNITKDENNVIGQVSANGVLQARLQATTSMEALHQTDLTTQISSKTDADLATTITRLQQTQTAYQAALQSSIMVRSLSILNYLP